MIIICIIDNKPCSSFVGTVRPVWELLGPIWRCCGFRGLLYGRGSYLPHDWMLGILAIGQSRGVLGMGIGAIWRYSVALTNKLIIQEGSMPVITSSTRPYSSYTYSYHKPQAYHKLFSAYTLRAPCKGRLQLENLRSRKQYNRLPNLHPCGILFRRPCYSI